MCGPQKLSSQTVSHHATPCSSAKVWISDIQRSSLEALRTRLPRVEIVADGRTLEHVGPGGVFGEMALLDSAPRAAGAVAATDCALLPVNRSQFLELVRSDPEFGLALLKALGQRLAAMSGAVQKN